MTFSVGPYRVIEKLGAGGMGEVFLAEDTRLGRRIALKQLTGAWIAAPDARERLLREARAAAVLNHPNIAAIYDVIEEGDRACLVMEYVEGENLAQRLSRGRLPPEQVITIGIQLAEALVEAHGRGVLHRDLKPGNIRLTPGGKVKILDFGIAKLQQAVTGQPEPRTGTDDRLGTPGYTAPEQLRGRTTDHRADIYSLGVVLYELLTGRLPVEGTDLVSLALATLKEHPPEPSDVDPNIPPDLSAAVARTLHPDRDKRTRTAAELLTALRAAQAALGERPTAPITADRTGRGLRASFSRLTLFGMPLILLAVSGTVLFFLGRFDRSGNRASTDGAVPVIAVLPFSNQSGDRANDDLAAGISAMVASTLGRVSAMSVVARPEVLQTRQLLTDLPSLAARLSASHVVDGSLHPSGDRLRVSVRLIGANGSELWRRSYAAAGGQVLAAQSQIVRDLSGALRVRLSAADERRLASVRNHDPAAVAEYWTARGLLERPDVPGNVARATSALERVVSMDPTLAEAHAALGEAYWARYVETTDIAWTRKAIDASQAALRIDPEQPAVHQTLATVYVGTGRRDEAITELRRALALRPNSVEAYVLLGSALADSGKVDEGVEQFHKAIALRPNYAGAHSALGRVLWRAGRNPEAARAFRKVTELQPDSAWAFQQLGTVYHTIGDTDRALENYERSIQIAPNARSYSNVGTLYYERGKYEEAARAYESAIGLSDTSDITRRNLGDAYRRLGRTAAARTQYERALQLAQAALTVNAKDADVLGRSAVYEAKLGRTRDARQHADAAVSLNPRNGRLHYYRAVVMALGGANPAAIASIGEAVRLGFASSRVREDDDLEKLRGTPAFEAALAQKP